MALDQLREMKFRLMQSDLLSISCCIIMLYVPSFTSGSGRRQKQHYPRPGASHSSSLITAGSVPIAAAGAMGVQARIQDSERRHARLTTKEEQAVLSDRKRFAAEESQQNYSSFTPPPSIAEEKRKPYFSDHYSSNTVMANPSVARNNNKTSFVGNHVGTKSNSIEHDVGFTKLVRFNHKSGDYPDPHLVEASSVHATHNYRHPLLQSSSRCLTNRSKQLPPTITSPFLDVLLYSENMFSHHSPSMSSISSLDTVWQRDSQRKPDYYFCKSSNKSQLKLNQQLSAELQKSNETLIDLYDDKGSDYEDYDTWYNDHLPHFSEYSGNRKSFVCPDPLMANCDETHNCQQQGCERVTINVSGMMFETRIGVLNRHPTTLLGNNAKRAAHYVKSKHEYFFDRHRPTFEAIFNYYQYGGKLKRPPTVPDEIFLGELEFYQIEQEVVDTYKRDEGYVIEKIVLPEHPTKRRVWMLFEYPETSTPAFFIAVMSVIFTIISIILFCVETLPRFSESHCVSGELPNFLDPFFILETICTFWFTVEVVIRFIVCPSKRAYVKDFKNHVDLAAIVPYYFTLINVLISLSCDGAKNSASLAFLRVIRLIRVFKLTKHSPGLQVLILTFRASIEGLGLFLVALIVCILVFSSTIYYVEFEVQDSQIASIPDAFWWAVITMCTVGYGDMVPKGYLGKLVGSVCAVAGVLTLAIPVPIITENFNKFYSHKTGRGRH